MDVGVTVFLYLLGHEERARRTSDHTDNHAQRLSLLVSLYAMLSWLR